jgi:hypothetical protein
MSKDFYIKATASGSASASGYYGAFQDNTDQNAVASNTAYAIKIGTTDEANGISIVNNGSGQPTRITFANTGVYNIQFSFQFQNTDSQDHDVEVWFRKNGTDIPSTNSKQSIPSKHGSVDGHTILALNYVATFVGGDYVELMWMAASTLVSLKSYSAGSPPPFTPSVILTVTQQAGIVAGTGITAINGLTNAVQTFSSGTSGTDFGISSAGTIHTFNLPIASSTNSGKLSNTDWSTFNSKEPTVASGTTLQYYRGDKTWDTLPIQNIQTTTDGTGVTGTTTSTLTASILIPANTVAVGDIIYVKTRIRKTGTAGTLTTRMYVNTSSAIGGSLIATSASAVATSLYFQYARTLAVKSATNTESMAGNLNVNADDNLSVTTAVSTSNIDWTINQYLVVAVQNGSTADTSRSSFIHVQINKP